MHDLILKRNLCNQSNLCGRKETTNVMHKLVKVKISYKTGQTAWEDSNATAKNVPGWKDLAIENVKANTGKYKIIGNVTNSVRFTRQ